MKRFGLIALSSLLIACSQSSDDLMEADIANQIVGKDRTEEGCIPSAGYQWSIVSQDCIRLWEAGTALTHQGSGDPDFNAFAITTADQAEIFLPDQSGSTLLARDTAMAGDMVWSNEAADLRLTFDEVNTMILTDMSGFVLYRDMSDQPEFDQIPDHAADDLGGDYAMEQGVVTKVEDGAYPMFTLHIQIEGETDPTPFSLMAEGVTVTGGDLYELAGKTVQFDYVEKESWDLMAINSADEEAYVPETVGEGWRFVIGRLEGADEISMGDLPDTLTISTISGERFELDDYIGEAMVPLNETDVAAWLAPRFTKEILSVTVLP